jgi:hypothetical protein
MTMQSFGRHIISTNGLKLAFLAGPLRAATENLRDIIGVLPRGLAKLRGDPLDCGRPRECEG